MTENLKKYFDDLEGHIEMLKLEASVEMDEKREAELKERIEFLKTELKDGKVWIDNDIKSPDAWKTLETYTEKEAEDVLKTLEG